MNRKFQTSLEAPSIVEATEENFIPLDKLKQGINISLPIEPSDSLTGVLVTLDGEVGSIGKHTPISGEIPLVYFDADRLLKFHGEKVRVSYFTLPDGKSSPSSEYQFDTELHRPEVPQIGENGMPWEALDKGIEVIVRHHRNIHKGDQVRLIMAGSNAGSSHIIVKEVTEAGGDLKFLLPPEKTRLTAAGQTSILYEVVRKGAKFQSLSTPFYSMPRLSELLPKHIGFPKLFEPWQMKAIDENGSYPFTLQLSPAPMVGDKLTVLALDDRNWTYKIVDIIVEKAESEMTILLPVDTFYSSLTQEFVVILDSSGELNSSPRTPIKLFQPEI